MPIHFNQAFDIPMEECSTTNFKDVENSSLLGDKKMHFPNNLIKTHQFYNKPPNMSLINFNRIFDMLMQVQPRKDNIQILEMLRTFLL